MIAKACIAGALALALEPSQAYLPPASFTHNPYIEKIQCEEGSGTGFKIADGRWVSVDHVTSNTGCSVDGVPIIVTYADTEHDFSTFIVPGDRRKGGLSVDCSGYQDQQWYHGQGHGGGLAIVQSVPVMFSKYTNIDHPKGWMMLIYNRFIRGQSGGPVFNNQGAVTGTVNALGIFFPVSFSRQMKDTIICGAPQ